MANPVYTDIVNGVAALMDDQSKAWAKEDFLLPFINMATRTVAAHLADNELPTIRFRTPAFTVPAGSTTVTASLSLALPDIIMEAPVTIWEGPVGADLSLYSTMTGSVPLSPTIEAADTLRRSRRLPQHRVRRAPHDPRRIQRRRLSHGRPHRVVQGAA